MSTYIPHRQNKQLHISYILLARYYYHVSSIALPGTVQYPAIYLKYDFVHIYDIYKLWEDIEKFASRTLILSVLDLQ